MQTQANNLKVYAFAAALWNDRKYSAAAEKIYSYLTRFLPGPSVEEHQYARENGWAIAALCWFYQYQGNADALKTAEKAADWVIKQRSLREGFSHDDPKQTPNAYLSDNVAMADAFFELYRSTTDRKWYDRSIKTMLFIDRKFKGRIGYLPSVVPEAPSTLKPKINREDNAAVAHLANILHQYSGDKKLNEMSIHAMRYLTSDNIAKEAPTSVVLLVEDEIRQLPMHLVVIGSKTDETAKRLYQKALSFPELYRRVEWWDLKTEKPIKEDVQYPKMDKPAAFVCTNSRCSLPIFDPEKFHSTIQKLGK